MAKKGNLSTQPNLNSQRSENMNAINEIQDQYALVQDQLKSAAAIVDAVSVLCALERAPEHHDTHPSHNITTGAARPTA